MIKPFARTLLSAALIAPFLVACSDSSSLSSAVPTGQLSVALTDAPVDGLESVFVTFKGLSVHYSGVKTTEIVLDTPITLDLLTLQNGVTAPILEGVELPAGDYQWIRLDLAESAGAQYVVDSNGGQYDLTIPSGAETGLKLVSGFTVVADGSTDFVIDFDLRKSVTLTGTSEYKLRPTLKLIDRAVVGSVAGNIDATLMSTACTDVVNYAGAVFVFEGSDAVVDDADADGVVGPYSVAPALEVEGTGSYAYEAAFLPEGPYTVAYSCDIDDLTADETLTFTPAVNTTVVSKQTAPVDFL